MSCVELFFVLGGRSIFLPALGRCIPKHPPTEEYVRDREGGDAGVGLVGDAEAGVAAGVGIEDKVGTVFAAVVGAEAFPVREGLREDGVEAFFQVGRHVVDGHNHGEEGRLSFFGGWRYRLCLWFHNVLSVPNP